jgi:hypothetical protein
MDFFTELFNRKEIWTIIGIILGFSLTEITRSIRKALENRRLRGALYDELDSIYFQLEQKKDLINNVINALDKMEIFPATSVAPATAIFDTQLAFIIKLLKPIERDDIQNIYGRLRILDKFFDNFEERFTTSLKDKVITDPWLAYRSMLNDHKNSCGVAQELILSVLEKKPLDIYSRKKKTPIQDRVFVGIATPDVTRKQRGD